MSELAAGVRGALTLPSDPGYDEARAVYNGAVDRRPAALVRCADVADVIACVNFAREHDMALAIRGGAHHGGGFGVWDDALVIDLGGLRSTTVNPAAHTVRVDGGCTWGDVDHATGRSAWRPHRVLSEQPAWADRPSVVASATCHGASASASTTCLCRRRAC